MDKKRILIVDDEEDILNVLRFRLEANNYEVLSASDGQEGLNKARSEKPDLIILDLMLPKLDGYKVCRMLKFDESYKAIPIIILDLMLPKLDGYKVCRMLKFDEIYKAIPIIIFTARAQKKDEEIGMEMGADAYIAKPFEPEILLGKMKELLGEI